MTWVAERPYGKIYRAFWTDPEITRLTTGRKVLLLYYFTAPHGNMAGLYHAPFKTTSDQTGLRLPTVKYWTLRELDRWVSYDLATSEILVHNGARANVGDLLTSKDKRRTSIERQLAVTHSERLRRLFVDLYTDWEMKVPINKEERSPFPKPLKDHTQGPSKGHTDGPPRGMGKSVAVAGAGAGTEILTVASQPRSNNTPDGPSDGELMGLVRTFLYSPNGKAPPGYNDARDITVIRRLRKAGYSGYDIADAIEGVRLLCNRGELGRKKPGEKLTMRALYNTRHGVRPLLAQAQEAVHQAQKRAPTTAVRADPEHIGASIARVLDAQKPARQ